MRDFKSLWSKNFRNHFHEKCVKNSAILTCPRFCSSKKKEYLCIICLDIPSSIPNTKQYIVYVFSNRISMNSCFISRRKQINTSAAADLITNYASVEIAPTGQPSIASFTLSTRSVEYS